MASDHRPPVGLGCLVTVLGAVALAAIAVLVLVVGLVALAVVAGLVVVGFLVWAVDRVLLALSPRRRERRASRNRALLGQFGPVRPGEVIDTTATDPTDDRDGRGPDVR